MLVIFSTLRLLIDVPFLIILPMRKNTACIEDISNHYMFVSKYIDIHSVIYSQGLS